MRVLLETSRGRLRHAPETRDWGVVFPPPPTPVSASVELWDVSGDQQYESCWPAITQGVTSLGAPSSTSPVDGVILVYNPEFPTHDTEVGLWYDAFVKNCDLPDSKCLVFTHRGDPKGGFRSRPPPKRR